MEKIIEMLGRATKILAEIQADPSAQEKWNKRGGTVSAFRADIERCLEILKIGHYDGDPITAVRTFRGRKPLRNLKHIADIRDGDF